MGQAPCCSVAKVDPSKVDSEKESSSSSKAKGGLDEARKKFNGVLKKTFKNPKDAFEKLNRDGDDELTKDEFMEALLETGTNAGWDEPTIELMRASGLTLFDEMDVSGDGKLTYTEFREELAKKVGIKNVAGAGTPKAVTQVKSEKGEDEGFREVTNRPSESPTADKSPIDDKPEPPIADKVTRSRSESDTKAVQRSSTKGDAEGDGSKRRNSVANDPVSLLKVNLKKSFKDPKEAFKALDKDGDAELDVEEFKETLRLVGKRCSWDKATSDMFEDSVQEIFDAIDENKDGTVTTLEFKKKMSEKKGGKYSTTPT